MGRSVFGPYRLPFAAPHENFRAGFLWVQPIGSRRPADIKTLENMLTAVCPSGAKKSFRTADLNDAGKAAKRRLRRIKRTAFEEAPRLAGAKQPETGWCGGVSLPGSPAHTLYQQGHAASGKRRSR